METQKTEQTPAKAPKKFWCNFCNFRTDDEPEYLQHSCRDELARKEKEQAKGA